MGPGAGATVQAGDAHGKLQQVRLAGGERLEAEQRVASAAVADGRAAVGQRDGDGRRPGAADERDEAVPEECVDRLHQRILELVRPAPPADGDKETP